MSDTDLDCRALTASFLTHAIGIMALAMLDCAAPDHCAPVVLLPSEPDVRIEDPEPFPEIERFDHEQTVLSQDDGGQMDFPDVPPLPSPIPAPDPAQEPSPGLPDVAFIDRFAPNVIFNRIDIEPAPPPHEAHASVQGAIERLTAEIQKTARLHPARVVWLFDASVSLTRQRAEVARRLEKVLGELHADPELQPVEHLVCGFGRTLGPVASFTSDEPEAAGRAVRAIPIDDSGIENTFAAIGAMLPDEASPARDQRTLIVVFTDEVGNDAQLVDKAITQARHTTSTIYVVGAVAPFGEDKAIMAFVEPDARFDQAPRDVRIEQGPETAFRMTLNIVTGPLDNQAIDSGFGSFALTRLCHETQGCYLALHPDRRPGPVDIRATSPLASRIIWFADPAAMARYRPDYRPRSIQDREAQTHVAKNALVKACSLPRLDLRIDLKTAFDAADQGRFVGELREAQKPAEDAAVRIRAIYQILHDGERAARHLREPRWRASYDLAMGRILAAKTKFEAYNRLLGNAKSGRQASHADTNRWLLEPSHELHCDDGALERQAGAARAYLNRVVEEHPGTPWALVAQQVLGQPLGYRWVEAHYDPPPPPQAVAPRPNPAPLQDDPARPRLVPKPQRDPQRI